MTAIDLAGRIEQRFASLDARVGLHVAEIGGSGSVSIDAGTPVVLASVVKIVLCVAFARQVAAGVLDPRERIDVPDGLRLGGAGATGCLDPVQMSLRDLARSMITVSDNAATDVVLERTGDAAITALLDELALGETRVRGGMHWGHMGVVQALGLPTPRDLDGQLERAEPRSVLALGWLDPARANAASPREIAALLAAIWSDRAGPPAACAFVREVMAEVLTTHGLAAAFAGTGATLATKTGTLPTIANEAGVVSYADGRRYAVAVFTRTAAVAPARPDIDTAIGESARIAVESLR